MAHHSKESLQYNEIKPPSRQLLQRNTFKPKQKNDSFSKSYLYSPLTHVIYKTEVKGPVKHSNLQDYGSMAPIIVSQQVKNNIDLLEKKESSVNTSIHSVINKFINISTESSEIINSLNKSESNQELMIEKDSHTSSHHFTSRSGWLDSF